MSCHTSKRRVQTRGYHVYARILGAGEVVIEGENLSALKGEGINKLLDAILLQAELLELKANPDRRAAGNVVESGMEPGGPAATVLNLNETDTSFNKPSCRQ